MEDRDRVGRDEDLAGHTEIKAGLAHDMKTEVFVPRWKPHRCKHIAHVAIDLRRGKPLIRFPRDRDLLDQAIQQV